MPKTNYKECRWLIKAVNQDYGEGSYDEGRGFSLRDLIDINYKVNHISIPKDPAYSTGREKKEAFRRSLINRRVNIYNEFGLAILMKSTSGTIKGKGLGGYYYYLKNPGLLKENKTLEEIIDFLADSETDRDSWVKAEQIASDYEKKMKLSMGFITAGGSPSYGFLSKEGTSYRTILGEENLELIQFAMQFGEVLTIKYGKIKSGVDINAPYSLEPYQLKEIEGRWYVIGNLYPLGHKEQAELAVYDLARLQFSDEENPDILYEPVRGFDIKEHLLIDSVIKRMMGKVLATVVLNTHTEEFAEYLSEHPLCSAQKTCDKGHFRLYIRLTEDLFVQLGAYGEELSLRVYIDKGFIVFSKKIIQRALNPSKENDERGE